MEQQLDRDHPLMSQIKELADYIADNLDQLAKAADWRPPWRGVPRCYQPHNGHEFSFLNSMLFWRAMTSRGFERALWATAKQWTDCERTVIECELARSTHAFAPRVGGTVPLKRTGVPNDEPRHADLTYNRHGYYNVEQTFGKDVNLPMRPTVHVSQFVDFVRDAAAVKLVETSQGAWYRYQTDELCIPRADTFTDLDGICASDHYYGTLLHELVHATGHPRRLDRIGRRNTWKRDSPEYAFEELIAELGASQLCVDLRVTPFIRHDHFDYLAYWASKLRQEPRALGRAAAQADKARMYLLAIAGNAILRQQVALRDSYSREELLEVLRHRLPNPDGILDVMSDQRMQFLVKRRRTKRGRPRKGESVMYARGPRWEGDIAGLKDYHAFRHLAYALGRRASPD